MLISEKFSNLNFNLPKFISRSKNFSRLIALGLATIVGLEAGLIPAAEANYLSPSIQNAIPSDHAKSIQTIVSNTTSASRHLILPKSLGQIVEIWPSKNQTNLIHYIQDVHNHVGTQTNISGIISLLQSRASLRGKNLLVFVEGASGEVESDSIAALTDDRAKKAIGAGLLRAGFLFGEEYAAITHQPGRIKLLGVETPSLYELNAQVETASEKERRLVLSSLARLRKQLELLKKHNFSPLMMELEKQRLDVESGRQSFMGYLQFLQKMAPSVIAGYPELKKGVQAFSQEKELNNKNVQQDVEHLIKNLLQNKPAAEVEALISEARAVKVGEVSALSFYSKLLAASSKPYPKLEAYLDYISKVERLSLDTLFDQAQEAEVEAARQLLRHPVSFQLYQHLRWVELQQKFFSLQLTPQEWELQKKIGLQKFQDQISAVRACALEQAPHLGYSFNLPYFSADELAAAVNGAALYYRAARRRDVEMARHIETGLEKYGRDNYEVAFIAGGFHTPGITKIFRGANLAYAIVRPNMEGAVELDQSYTFPTFRTFKFDGLNSSEENFRREPGGLALAGPSLLEAFRDPSRVPDQFKRVKRKSNPKKERSVLDKLASFANPNSGRAAAMGVLAFLPFLEDPIVRGALGILLAGAIIWSVWQFSLIRRSVNAFVDLMNWLSRGSDGSKTGSLPLTPIQERVSDSHRYLAQLDKDGKLDQQKLAEVQDYATAFMIVHPETPEGDVNSRLIIVKDTEGSRIRLDTETPGECFVVIPERYVRNDREDQLDLRIDLEKKWSDEVGADFERRGIPMTKGAYLKLKFALQEEQKAAELGFQNVRLYHNHLLDNGYIDKWGRWINNEDFKEEFWLVNNEAVKKGMEAAGYKIDEGGFLEADQDRSGHCRDHLPFLLQRWYEWSNRSGIPAELRDQAKKSLAAAINMMSAVPSDLATAVTQGEIKAPLLPNESDLVGDESFVGDPRVDDVDPETMRPGSSDQPYQVYPTDKQGAPMTREQVRRAVEEARQQRARTVYAGDIAHRFFAGGMARRLGLENLPAALVTGRQAVEWERKNMPFPDFSKAPYFVKVILESVVRWTRVLWWPIYIRIMAPMPDFPDVPVVGRFIQQIIAGVVQIAQENGWDVQRGLFNQKIIIPMNEDSSPLIIKHLQEMDFYGLSPHSFYFLEQRTGPGFGVREVLETQAGGGGMKSVAQFYVADEVSETAEVGTYGHGELEYKHNMTGEAFTVGRTGTTRYYRRTPLHAIMSAQDAIYSHVQISLNDAMRPGWWHEENRMAIGLGAMNLGFEGSAEFRKDDTGTKGGMTGYGRFITNRLLRFFNKSSEVLPGVQSVVMPEGMDLPLHYTRDFRDVMLMPEMRKRPFLFTIEGSQTNVSWGKGIKEALQGYTANASVVLVKARSLMRVVKPASYPPIATVRTKSANDHQTSTIHPDTWSYWYFNMLNVFFFVPRLKREELKEAKHYPLFAEYTRRQDDPRSNPIYYESTAPYQKRLQNRRPPASSQPISSAELVWVSVVLVIFGLAFMSLGMADLASASINRTAKIFASASVATLILSLAAKYFAEGNNANDRSVSLNELRENPSMEQSLVAAADFLVRGITRLTGRSIEVLIKPGILGEGEEGRILLGFGLFQRSNFLTWIIRLGLLVMAIFHETYHAIVPQLAPNSSINRAVNEFGAFTIGALFILFLPFVAMAAAIAQLEAPLAFEGADAGMSYHERVLPSQLAHPEQQRQNFVDQWKEALKTSPHRNVAGTNFLVLDLAGVRPEAQGLQLAADMDEAVRWALDLHKNTDGDAHNQRTTELLVLGDPNRPELEILLRGKLMSLNRAGVRVYFVSPHEFGKVRTALDREKVVSLFERFQVNGVRGSENLYFLSDTDPGMEGVQFVRLYPNPYHLALVLYASTRFNDINEILNQLLNILVRTLKIDLHKSLGREQKAILLTALSV